MPRKAKELSSLEVKRLTKPGNHAVGCVAGLYIYVKDSGARAWVLRYQVGGKRRHLGLGGYPDVTLAQAHDRSRKAHDQIRAGIDPLDARRLAEAELAKHLTFAEATDRFFDDKRAEFGSVKHAKQWRSGLDQHVIPRLGKLTVEAITVQDVLAVLSPIWATKYPTAKKLRQRMEAVLAWATVNGHCSGDNPARLKGNLDAVLPKASAVSKTQHHPTVAVDEAADFFAEVCRRDGNAARALELIALTGARSGEARGAVWSEIDLRKRLWTIPAARMGKAKREHVVTLSTPAIELLMAQTRESDLIFPAQRGGMLSDAAVGACMKRIQSKRAYRDPKTGKPAVPHGLRSTFRDWAAEHTDYPKDMAEFAIAHVVGSDVQRAYLRTTMVEKRRAMMQAWATWLRGAA